jgi:outer membrane protein assembly factor BamD
MLSLDYFAPRRPSRLVAGIAVVAALAACSSKKEQYVERPVHEIYNEAVNALEAGNYRLAARTFDEVERQHPYSAWATKAQIMSAYAYYESNDYDEAVIALDRFIQLHPGNRDIAYAYYLKALCQYERISDIVRDQLTTEKALDSLQEVVRRFPDSKYARDARLKIDLTRDHLAGKEMEIGRYYLKRAHYLASINRFRRVVDEFQTTSHVQEALHRLVEAYTALGLTVEAQKAAAVLGHNYPGSEWYADSYAVATGIDVREASANERGMVSRMWNWIF